LQEDQLPEFPFPALVNLFPYIRTSPDLDSFSTDAQGHAGLCSIKLFSRIHVDNILYSYHKAAQEGPATVNRWFADALTKEFKSRRIINDWRQYLELHQRHVNKTYHPLAFVPPLLVQEPRALGSIRRLSISETSNGTRTDDGTDPLKETLSDIADKIIQDVWGDGSSITHGTCSRFAVNLLIAVRTNHLRSEALPADAIEGLAGISPKPRLTLRHMKYVYDHKVKPLAEKLQKKLFRCASQDCQIARRTYDLEGVMMHCAKHSPEYSNGAKKIDWDNCDWPRILPFTDTSSGPFGPYYQVSPSYSPWNSPQVASNVPSPMSLYRQHVSSF
jgi:hypothetical protein